MVTTTRYIHDGNQFLAEADEHGTIYRLYTNEPDVFTHLISQEEVSSGDSSYYHFDAVGSTREVTDDTETVTDEFTFDAWGNRLSRTGTSDLLFQFVGEHGYCRNDEDATFYIMARIYDPTIIRWMSPDPAGMLDSINLYVYANNNCVIAIDPSGMYHGQYCGPFSVGPGRWIDEVDKCCYQHDRCLANVSDFLFPGRVFYCDQKLAYCAACAIRHCHKSPLPASCRIAGTAIATWFSNPFGGTTPFPVPWP